MLEAEVLGIDFNGLMDLVERYISFLLRKLLDYDFVQTEGVLETRICWLLENFHPERIPYSSFIENLKEASCERIPKNVDLSDVDCLVSKIISGPVFVTDYPFGTWTALRSEAGKYILAFNLILPDMYGELCEGCQRTNDGDYLLRKFNCARIDNHTWYANSAKSNNSARSGFGLGLDRLIRWIAGLEKIQDTTIFFR